MTTTVQKVAMVFGVVFLLVAIVGFIAPGGMSMAMDPQAMIFGMFPVNLLHNIVHLLFGIWGLAAARSWSGAKQYAQITGVLYIILAVCGFFIPDGFGMVPLGGSDIWLHALIGVVLAAVGFSAKAETVTTTTV
jgi:hypothetical protein